MARRSADTVEVQLRETERWSVVGSVAVEDPFEESHCSFHATSRPDVAALWLAAGQNGQRVYWVTKGPDTLGVEPEPFLDDTIPPVFAPNGNEFLVIDDLGSVCKYPFPADRKLGTCRSKWGGADSFEVPVHGPGWLKTRDFGAVALRKTVSREVFGTRNTLFSRGSRP